MQLIIIGKTHMKTILFVLFSFVFIVSPLCAEPLYRWFDKDGQEQYSNTPPSGYEDGTVEVDIIDEAKTLSFQSEFIEKKNQSENVNFLTDDEWLTQFKRFDALPPRLSEDTKAALAKIKKIIADEELYVDRVKRRLQRYGDQYAKRKAEYEHEREENEKRGFDMAFWRPKTVVESEEEYTHRKENYKEQASYHGLILAWARQKEIQYTIKLQQEERQKQNAEKVKKR